MNRIVHVSADLQAVSLQVYIEQEVVPRTSARHRNRVFVCPACECVRLTASYPGPFLHKGSDRAPTRQVVGHGSFCDPLP
jgi:hypothetical protein